jgi:hypothetical protein
MTLIAIHHDMSFQDKLTAINSHYTGDYDG